MRRFCDLFRELDETTKTARKNEALKSYFADVDAADGAWGVYILCGHRFKRLVRHKDMRQWGAQQAGLEDWLFEECYHVVGDLAETIGLVIDQPRSQAVTGTLTEWIEQTILPLARQTGEQQRETLQEAWSRQDVWTRFVFNKLITGGLRVGVSQKSVIKAIADQFSLDASVVAHRLMGNWEPTPEFFRGLISPETSQTRLSQPYPFCLAHPLQQKPASLGPIERWHAEWKWDGIRAQVIRRGAEAFLWSRGEELLNERFPEFKEAFAALPEGTVLDGEVVGWKQGQVLPFGELQKRIGRKTVGKKLLADVPVRFLAFDLLEQAGADIRELAFAERRSRLEELLGEASRPDSEILLSPALPLASWEDWAAQREKSRDLGVEGLMLKQREGRYEVGRVTGNWWKWKIEPYTIDAVLIYAQAGHGRRASLYTDYTFALWDNGVLVPFAKAYSGLTDAELKRVDRFIRANTQEKFGPVRSVTPELVFELAFENIQLSRRHKSGVAVRFPRIQRWREDKRPDQADTLDALKAMMPAELVASKTVEEESAGLLDPVPTRGQAEGVRS